MKGLTPGPGRSSHRLLRPILVCIFPRPANTSLVLDAQVPPLCLAQVWYLAPYWALRWLGLALVRSWLLWLRLLLLHPTLKSPHLHSARSKFKISPHGVLIIMKVFCVEQAEQRPPLRSRRHQKQDQWFKVNIRYILSLAVAGLCQREKKERRKEEGKRNHNKEKTEREAEIKRRGWKCHTHRAFENRPHFFSLSISLNEASSSLEPPYFFIFFFLSFLSLSQN